jgi:hypothetical protein
MAAYIAMVGGDTAAFHIGGDKKLDTKVASRVSTIQADGHELELIQRHLPYLVSRARVQRFYGDIAKMIYYNVLCSEET